MTELTFDRVCEMDPRIRELEADVKEFAEVYGRLPQRCANAAWYGYGRFHGKGFKPRVLALVGDEREPPGYVEPKLPPLPSVASLDDPIWDERLRLQLEATRRAVDALPPDLQAHEPALRSSAAYDVVYDHLYQLLPDCKNCGCM